MKVKHITDENELKVGSEYVEIYRNSNLIDTQIKDICTRFEVLETPRLYSGKCKELQDSKVVLTKHIWSDGYIGKPSEDFLNDMGIPPKHNNHQVYEILSGTFEELSKLTLEEFYKVEGAVFVEADNPLFDFEDDFGFDDCVL